MTRKPNKGTPGPIWGRRFQFADGSHEDISIEEWEGHYLRQARDMIAHDNPNIQAAGHARFERVTERLARDHRSTVQRKVAASAKRPGRGRPLTEKIIGRMRKARAGGQSFKEFLHAWRHEPQDGLRITESDRGFLIDDENDVNVTSKYTEATLQKTLWRRAAKAKNRT